MVAKKDTHLFPVPPPQRQNVDAQEEFGGYLRAPLQGGCDGGQEGHAPPQAPRDRRAQPAGHEDTQFAEVPRVREGVVRVEDVLLVPDQRGHPVPPGLPPPPRRDRPLHPQEAGARRTTTEDWSRRPARRSADGRQDGRGPRRLPEGAWRLVRRRQGWRRGAGLRAHGVQGRLRQGQDRTVKRRRRITGSFCCVAVYEKYVIKKI